MDSLTRSVRVPTGRNIALGILVVCFYETALAQMAPRPIDPALCVVGDSYRVSASWFQFLGTTPGGRGLWLYPHVDGVHEIFEEKAGGPWEGDLESLTEPLVAKRPQP